MMHEQDNHFDRNSLDFREKIAIIGSGVSGLAAASVLVKAGYDVTVYEKSSHVGGHAQTLNVNFGTENKDNPRSVLVDVGFMVFNHCTYTNMIPWLEAHNVQFEPSNMSLAVSLKNDQGQELIEWSSDFNGLVARRKNMIDPSFWTMIYDMNRFNQDARVFLNEQNGDSEEGYSIQASDETLGNYLRRKAYSRSLIDFYIVPVCAAVWSCPREQVLDFPAYFILTFMKNHHLLQINGRPQWYTIAERTQHGYVRKVAASFWNKIKTNTEIISVRTESKYNGKTIVKVVDRSGEVNTFDHCILACHAPDAVKLLGDRITSQEKSILSAFPYYDNKIYLHRDPKLMPMRKATWASWNFMGTDDKGVFVTYWLNRLQNLDETICQGEPVLVSLNPCTPPRSDLIEAEWVTGHPIPTVHGATAQREIQKIQGSRHLWFAGAYLRFGFHEDGVRSGFTAARLLLESLGNKLDSNKFYELKPCIQAFQLGWIESSARLFVKNFLSQYIIVGNLELREIGGQVFTFKGIQQKTMLPLSSLSIETDSSLKAIGLTSTNPLHVIVEIVRPGFYSKIMTRHDLGLADAFIDGDCRMPSDKSIDLVSFFELIILNREAHFKRMSTISSLGKLIPNFIKSTVTNPLTTVIGTGLAYWNHIRRKNSLTNARQNIQAHYDVNNDMFALFLDQTMTYSAGIFKSPTETLYQAQINKIEELIAKLRVRSTDHVLEIGFGWGSLSIALAKKVGCRVTGITLSSKQKEFAEERVAAEGLTDRINFVLSDYRDHEHSLGKEHKYDRIVSCEMLEAVGQEYLAQYFFQLSLLLKQDGIVVMQVITTSDHRYDQYCLSSDFIKEQIFPCVCAPSLSAIVQAATHHSDLVIEYAENSCGLSYARTLELWRHRFEANKEKIMALDSSFDEKFIRKWIYYFTYCESGFRTRTLDNYHIVLSRVGNENSGFNK